jgi:RNA polymerase sigma-70 factor (ECF subfamily)
MLQSAQAGNNAALEQIFEMNLDRIYTLSHRLTGNKSDAEALASKTFVEAWNQLNKIRTDVPFNLWLESLNVHIALQQPEDVKEEKKKWGFSKKKKIEIKEPDSKLTPLEKEICKLPDKDRRIFVLHHVENYLVDELSSMVDISPQKLREKLKSVDEILLKKDFIQTSEVLSKKISEFPKQIKADKKILTEALNEIYEVKLKDRVEEVGEEEEVPEETVEITETVKPKPDKVTVEKEISIDIPTVTPKFKNLFWRVLVGLVVAVVIFLIIITGSKSWEVNLKTGTASLDGEQLTGNFQISSDETIQTEEGSKATVLVPNIGSMTIEPMTELRRLAEKNSAALIKGIIKADYSSAKEFFSLQVPGATISDYYLGSFYTADVRNDKSGYVQVNNGWISTKSNYKEIIAPTNYIIEFNETFGLSMPYHKYANSELISAVKEFAESKSELYVERIVSLSNKSESITLWNLLKSVSRGKRLLVYGKLNEIIPHPSQIRKEDILNLDNEKMQIWLEEIEKNM